MATETSSGTENYLGEKSIYKGPEKFLELYRATKYRDTIKSALSQSEEPVCLSQEELMAGFRLKERDSIRKGDKIWILDLLPGGKSFPPYTVGSSEELYNGGTVPAEVNLILKDRYWRVAPE